VAAVSGALFPVVFAGLALLGVVLFQGGIHFPLWMSVAVMAAVSVYLVERYRRGRIGVVALVLWLVYVLPFIHIPPYLWFDFDAANPLLLWGLFVNPYMLDEATIRLTAMLGAAGGLGIALGVALSYSPLRPDDGRDEEGERRPIRTLPFRIWGLWVAAGVVLSWLSAPEESLFSAVYTASGSVLDRYNFSSAWMVSYVLLTFAFCDALLESRPAMARRKRRIIIAAVAFIVVFFQLLRGSRESIPWVFALLVAYFHWAVSFTRDPGYRLPWAKILPGAAVLVALSMVVGAVRHLLTEIGSVQEFVALLAALHQGGVLGVSNLLHGTWSAVLLTPLSVAGDFVNGRLDLKMGRDYLDLLLSVPPGLVTDLVGYERPIDATRGPAWDMRYGMGGTHAVVLPFMNFRMAGVVLIPALWAYLVVRYEKFAVRRVSVANLSLLVTIVLAAPHWLWYGEKNGFNALVLWLALSVAYRFGRGVRAVEAPLVPSPARVEARPATS
jgi:hypothetical protein